MSLADINHVQAALPWQAAHWDGLMARLQDQRMAHALMLRGEAGTGKNQFALALAQYLLCSKPVANTACGKCKGCQLNLAGSHPDMTILEPEEPGRAIKVDQVRQVVDFVSKKAQLDGFRIVIVSPAEAMNVNASNALLKSLEEPGERTVLILVSHQITGVLPTIRSRCQVLDFPIPGREQALAWLNTLVGDTAKSEKLLNVAGGAPVRALELNQSQWLGERATVLQHWLGVLTGKRDPVRTAEAWSQYPIVDVLAWLLAWHIDLAKLVAGGGSVIMNEDLRPDLQAAATVINLDRLFACHDHLLQVKRMLNSQGNPNPQLLLEEILLKWSQAGLR
ncbi:DNA polymerase III subunit delta' [Ketobacter sp.]|uniref:DNA polymerase III subunit delta' n=1 Tax=Ketobacter sp. TaxID=2083498 RepID=UPI000F1C4516|nr:DNA polymerase III subunit delta' [Ketobacter sp.]RLT97899.1 MAG: DNA polymerase III subunit delta' [Ketobacter sp.]